jgi:hypothetical protein
MAMLGTVLNSVGALFLTHAYVDKLLSLSIQYHPAVTIALHTY